MLPFSPSQAGRTDALGCRWLTACSYHSKPATDSRLLSDLFVTGQVMLNGRSTGSTGSTGATEGLPAPARRAPAAVCDESLFLKLHTTTRRKYKKKKNKYRRKISEGRGVARPHDTRVLSSAEFRATRQMTSRQSGGPIKLRPRTRLSWLDCALLLGTTLLAGIVAFDVTPRHKDRAASQRRLMAYLRTRPVFRDEAPSVAGLSATLRTWKSKLPLAQQQSFAAQAFLCRDGTQPMQARCPVCTAPVGRRSRTD